MDSNSNPLPDKCVRNTILFFHFQGLSQRYFDYHSSYICVSWDLQFHSVEDYRI